MKKGIKIFFVTSLFLFVFIMCTFVYIFFGLLILAIYPAIYIIFKNTKISELYKFIYQYITIMEEFSNSYFIIIKEIKANNL